MWRGAVIDPSGRYRTLLWRVWRAGGPRALFVMLNPSAADARREDPTLRRCLGFARDGGFGGLEVVNLFSYRSPHPAELRRAADPVGPGTDRQICRSARRAACVIAAWGAGGALRGRDGAVLALLRAIGPVYALGRTRSGAPRHPLYLPARCRPRLYAEAARGSGLSRPGRSGRCRRRRG